MKKYELVKDDFIIMNDKKLYRIRVLIDIPRHGIKKGDIGGYIQSEDSLSHDGDCWVSCNGKVYEAAQVLENALICDNANIRGEAKIYGEASICDNAWVHGEAQVFGKAIVYNEADIYGTAKVDCSVRVGGDTHISWGDIY